MKTVLLTGMAVLAICVAAHVLIFGVARTSLDEAVSTGNVADVRAALNSKTLNESGEMGRTPLELAAWSGKADVVSFLLDRGADPNLCDSFGLTPLNCAAMRGDVESMTVLLQHGADINRLDSHGRTALSDAIACLGSYSAVEWLLDHGADPNLTGGDRWSALHQAAARGDSAIVRLLIHRGANAHFQDGNGRTPFAAARAEHHWRVMRELHRYMAFDAHISRFHG
jgi:ankyrin repeat protein